jgi:L-iditol 2-dehydrogenase
MKAREGEWVKAGEEAEKQPQGVGHARPGDLLVIGAGPIGLLHLMIARGAGAAGRITVVEPRENRREAARRLGADEVIEPAEFAAVERFDAVILATGIGEMVNPALRAVRKEGRINLFAGFDAGSAFPVDLNAIHYKQLQISGASESRRRDFAEALSLHLDGRLDLGAIITHRLPLSSYEEAFRIATEGTALKVAFELT